MKTNVLKWNGLTSNQLKIIALIAMTCDHVGKQLLPQYTILQIIGRLTFPIFAYAIAEGCSYTRNRIKYLAKIAVLALVCQIVYFVAMGSLYQCVLVTFSLSILLIYALDNVRKHATVKSWLIAVSTLVLVVFVSVLLPCLMKGTDFYIDYGIGGILLPVFVYAGKTKTLKLVFATIVLLVMSWEMGGIQWYALGAILLLAMYNGKRGKTNMKNLFYIYYPLHLVAIYVMSIII